MKRVLLAGAMLLALATAQPSFAADAPVYKGPAPVAAALFNWSGFYIGGHVGGAWLDANYLSNHVDGIGPCLGSGFITPCDPVNNRASNFIGGGQIGLRWQQGQWVFGLEGSLAATRLEDTTVGFSGPGLNYTSDLRSIFTATVQAGLAWDRALWYVKGGYAGGQLHFDSLVGGTTGPVSTWVNGWTVGTGLEYALIGNLSVGVEYDYIRLTGDASTCSPNAGSVFTCPVPPGLTLRYANYTANIHQVLVRLNYKFGL